MPDIFVNGKKSERSKIKEIIKETGINLFTSTAPYPKGINFKDQEPEEVLLLFLRKKFQTNLGWISTALTLSLLPVFVLYLSNITGYTIPFLTGRITLFLIIFYYLVVFSYSFINFISWFYNIAIVTNIKVIDINYSGLLSQNIAMTKNNLIEDVNYTQTGFFQSLFNYGDIYLQTAGETSNFHFVAVSDPSHAADTIEDLIGGKHGTN